MAIHSFYQTLISPLSPRVEVWVRRVFGAGQAVLASLAGIRAIQLISFLYRDTAIVTRTGGHPPDPHGFGFLTVVLFLIPSTVLLAFGSVSVWRKWSVPWWLPLVVILGLCGATYSLLS